MRRKFVKWVMVLAVGVLALGASGCPQEAPQSFQKQNGFLSDKQFDEAKDAFDEIETPEDGLGVHFNESSCAGCHVSTVKGGLTGGSGPVTELRAGHLDPGGQFVTAPGGTLITLLATGSATPEVKALPASENVRDRFITLSLFGDGFVECVADDMLRRISREQNARTGGRIRGLIREVGVFEAPGKKAVGRFGWAAQHASLLSFAADAYRNEMGITSKFEPEDNTFFGQKVPDKADPEDTGGTGDIGEDVEFFAQFMRALSAPPRNFPADAKDRKEVEEGAKIFKNIGCNVCHLTDLVTAKTGSKVNGGAFTVPAALGNKRFHPYGDFLMHDIGTGPAILREGMPAETKNKIRTGALWGMGSRLANGEPLLHDGSAKTPEEAIERHKNSAAQEADKFRKLNAKDKERLLKFLRSL